MNSKKPALYIMTNKVNGTLYIGVTSDLTRRVFEHKQGLISGFTSKYNCKTLVWYCFFETMNEAICMEKKLKDGPRLRKTKLINDTNPLWNDLYEDFFSTTIESSTCFLFGSHTVSRPPLVHSDVTEPSIPRDDNTKVPGLYRDSEENSSLRNENDITALSSLLGKS